MGARRASSGLFLDGFENGVVDERTHALDLLVAAIWPGAVGQKNHGALA
jgi:hypothetical protein